ncbi:MAG: alpha/beta hydrolase [Microthrixaceae bacterium]
MTSARPAAGPIPEINDEGSGQGPAESASTAPARPAPRGPLPGLVGWADRRIHDTRRSLESNALARAATAVPRTAKFVGATAYRQIRGTAPGLPVPTISPALAAQVAMDETILAMALGPNLMPSRADYERVSAELAHARLLFDTNGWIDSPLDYHQSPPALVDPVTTTGWALGQRYERLLFPSGWSPHPGEPGEERWTGYGANRTASVTVLRHEGEPRPWVVGAHGFGCGYAFMDFIGLHALHLHRDLGLNVALPVLPLHGSRRNGTLSGEGLLSFDLINTLHGLTQSVWDIRRLIGWIRTQDAPSIGVYGVSLGGYVSSLLTTVEDGIDCVIAGIPVVDIPEMFRHQSPHRVRMRAIEHEILGGNAEAVHHVVSPLASPCLVPKSGRFIFGGLGDRMAPPTQAHQLWNHWDQPEILWYGGNHVGYLWSRQVTAFLGHSLASAGLVDPKLI